MPPPYVYVVTQTPAPQSEDSDSDSDATAALNAFTSRLRANASARALLRRQGENLRIEEYQNSQKLYRGTATDRESGASAWCVKVVRVELADAGEGEEE